MMEGVKLEVAWKKPVDKLAYNQRKQHCQALFAPKSVYLLIVSAPKLLSSVTRKTSLKVQQFNLNSNEQNKYGLTNRKICPDNESPLSRPCSITVPSLGYV